MGKARVGLFVMATVLVLAGCVGRTGGDAERAPATGTPVRLFDNVAQGQVDPCSLTGPAAYRPRGTARMPGRPDMDSCRVSVATDDGPAYVWVGEQADLPSVLEPEGAPGGHSCRWGEPDGNWAILRTPVAESPAELGVPAGTPAETIADRESWVVPGQVDCTVYYRHIEFGLGVGTFEFAELTVATPGDPCAAARTLAASAWEHLPRSA